MKRRNLLKMLIAFTGLLTVSSCEKRMEEEFKLLNKSASVVTPMSAGDGLYDLLGYGYDVTKGYAVGQDARHKVLNIEKLAQDFPSRVNTNLSSEQQWISTYGSNAVNFLEKKSAKVTSGVNIPLFKSSVTTLTSDSNSFSSKYVYGSNNLTIQQKRLSVNATNDFLRGQYLDPVFQADVISMTPQQLVSTFGTHVMLDIKLGGVLEVLYRAETTNSDRTQAATIGMEVGAFDVFKVGSTSSQSRQIAENNFNQRLFYRTRGGDGSKGLIGTINLDGTGVTQLNIATWQNSVTIAESDLIDFGDNSLVPIYEFINDATKKTAVKSYVEQYLVNNQVALKYERIPIYRYFNNNTKNHFYTKINGTPSGYTSEGIAFYAYSSQIPNTVPIHRYFFPGGREDHFYSAIHTNIPGYNYEGIEFFAFSSQTSGAIPVYSFYNNTVRNHVLTTTPNIEILNGYVNEGIVFYAFSSLN